MRVTKAIILAAGMGSRIKKLYPNKPKCLIKIPKKKTSIIGRQIQLLKKNDIKDILVITGYKSNVLKKELSKFKNIRVGYYPYYKLTNNLNTLLHFKNELNSSFVCLFADVVFDKKILDNIIAKQKNLVAAIDTSRSLKDTMRVKIKKKKLIDIGSHISTKKGHGNFIGICKFSQKGSKMLKKNLSILSKKHSEYYTIAIKKMIKNKHSVNYFDCKGLFWKEIDTIQDYKELKKNSFKI